MRLYHNSRMLTYRRPFGAVNVGTEVFLKLSADTSLAAEAKLRVWTKQKGECIFNMEKGEDCFFITINADHADIFWYSFMITAVNGEVLWYGAQEGTTGGEGCICSHQPPSFQISVSEYREVPKWYTEGLVYQIFPDRFSRGGDYESLVKNELSTHLNGPKRVFNEDWYKTPSYKTDKVGNILEWEFYGGNLEGIIEKLDHIEELHATAIYLNPVFDAASNHRYDTGDYMKISSMLGNEETFRRLCSEAKKRGIRIILDGVFNHTGYDSIYFNRFGNYDSIGAYDHPESPYRSWYTFDNSKNGYESWWGVADLPQVREREASYGEYIYKNEDSVVKHWLKAGADGFRLDVADELPDDFIMGIKEAVVDTKGSEGLLIGEVWEDASNKISYGELRSYFNGRELDGVMNYPLRDGVIDFLTYRMSAFELADRLTALHENYPKTAFLASLNVFSTHDSVRLLSALEAGSDEKTKRRLKLAVFTQMTMPGVPCIYYGDEVGVRGGKDPENRAPYPWGREDTDILKMYKNAIEFRRSDRLFIDGDLAAFAENEDVFCFRRFDEKGSYLIMINRDPDKEYSVCGRIIPPLEYCVVKEETVSTF